MESRSLLVTRHEPSTFPKNGIKNANNFWNWLREEKILNNRDIQNKEVQIIFNPSTWWCWKCVAGSCCNGCTVEELVYILNNTI